MDPPFPCPAGVNVADSVTLKLSPTNYFAWKQLMVTFVESHDLSGFIDGTMNPPNKLSLREESLLLEEERCEEEEEEEKGERKRQEDWDQDHWGHWDWERERLAEWVREQERREEWEQERREGKGEREQEQEQERREKWKREWEVERKESEEQKERRKEWDRERERRNEWDRKRERREKRKQERREEERIYTGWKRSDGLVREWILAMVTEEILIQVMHLITAREVWIKIGKILNPPFQLSRLHLIGK